MSLNKKGFVLIETLAVTVFAATIFVFLFKSVVPIMGIYDTKIDQIGAVIPITGIVGDQQGALFGQLCINKGDIKSSLKVLKSIIKNKGIDTSNIKKFSL